MSEAIALEATEQCRALVANPQKWGLEVRQGLEPLDVVVKFNRPAAHTRSAYQVQIQMRITLDDGATWRTERALVAEGKTKADCLEMFYNWFADPSALATFTEVVKAHDVDVLAKKALEERAAEEARVAGVARGNNANWAERKLDGLMRKAGLKDKKVTLS